MCGRYALALPRDQIRALLGQSGMQAGEWIEEDNFVPRYNIAPNTQNPVIRRRDPASSELIIHTMQWGSQGIQEEGKALNTINARSENIVNGQGMWAHVRGERRCVVICQGFYEWLKKGNDRLPHFTKHRDGRLMLLAGLCTSLIQKDGSGPKWTFTIVTTDASKEFNWLHDRQPVILSSGEAIDLWLDTSNHSWTSGLTALVRPYSDSLSPLECFQVPQEVGKVGSESSTFVEPVRLRRDGIQAMFAQQRQKRGGSRDSSKSSLIKRKRSPSSTPAESHTAADDISPRKKQIKQETSGT